MTRAKITIGSFLAPVLALIISAVFHYGEAFLDALPASATMAINAAAILALVGAVFTAVRHAETIEHRLGQPLGTLVLTIAVTCIEVSILSQMVLQGDDNPTVARETIFSAVMIVCNGLVGLCLFVGALRHREQVIQPVGTSAYLAVLTALAVLTLILPNYTLSSHGPTLTESQLAFLGVASALLYGAFLFIQTVRHRSHFMDIGGGAAPPRHARPTPGATLYAAFWLFLSVLSVVLLSESVLDDLPERLSAAGFEDPESISGALLALLVLSPEAVSAIRAAMRNAIQTALNSALGSVLATVGLTVPAVAAVSVMTHTDLVLGLDKRDSELLWLTLLLGTLSFGSGRTNVLTGLVHLVVFAVYVFLLFVP